MHLKNGVAALLGVLVMHAGASESHALIGAADLAKNAVTTAKIKNLAVTGGKIANYAVTPRKISSNGNVIVVAPAGGDFTSPVAALASITAASESNPYLVKLMPGVYDIGGGSVIMKPYVDLEGSGELVTTIRGTVSTPFDAVNADDTRPLYGVVTMADESEVRFLTVVNSGAAAGSKCVAAIVARDADARLSHVRAAANGTNCNVGIVVNITETDNGDVVLLRDVQAFAEGGVTAIGMGVRGTVAEMAAATINCILQAQGAGTNNFGLNVTSASPIIKGGVLMAEGGSNTLALRGVYGLPSLHGVMAMGAMSFNGNVGVAAINQCSTGSVFVNNAYVDIFNSSVLDGVTVFDSGLPGSIPSVARCAGTVRTDTLATLDADCSSTP